MPRVLTFDLGTTYLKAALFGDKGDLLYLVRRPQPIQRPQPDRCELDPACFLALIENAVAELVSASDGLGEVAAMSFATQANSFALFDSRDQPLTPFILWPDERALPYSSRLHDLVNGLPLLAITGVPIVSHQFAPAKLLWLRDEQPDVLWRARRLCFLSDYLTLWATGQHASDASSAALSGFVDIHRIAPWSAAFDQFQVPKHWLGQLVRPGTPLGPIRPALADSLGLPRACQYVVGCLDQYAGAIGCGVVTPASLCETTGTVLATVRCARGFNPAPPPQVFQGPSFDPGLYYRMAFGSRSANLLEAYRATLIPTPSFSELDAQAAAIAPGADGLRLSPGADSVRPDSLFSHRAPSAGHAVRAILEGVAVALRQQVTRVCGQDEPPAEIRCAGGAARSELWRQIKAAVLDCPIAATACPEPTSLGAAILAASAITGESVAALAQRWAQPADVCVPDATLRLRYAELFPVDGRETT